MKTTTDSACDATPQELCDTIATGLKEVGALYDINYEAAGKADEALEQVRRLLSAGRDVKLQTDPEIRWVNSEGVHGHPTAYDCLADAERQIAEDRDFYFQRTDVRLNEIPLVKELVSPLRDAEPEECFHTSVDDRAVIEAAHAGGSNPLTDDLLPCPLCGAKAKLVGYYHRAGQVDDVRCTATGCTNNVWSTSRAEWQRRPTSATGETPRADAALKSANPIRIREDFRQLERELAEAQRNGRIMVREYDELKASVSTVATGYPWEAEQTPAVQEAVRKVLEGFGEIPDRNSPDDFPEGYVLTRAEIVEGMLSVLSASRSATAVGFVPVQDAHKVQDDAAWLVSWEGSAGRATGRVAAWRDERRFQGDDFGAGWVCYFTGTPLTDKISHVMTMPSRPDRRSDP